MKKTQIIFLGRQRQPIWGKREEDEEEIIKWYKIIPNGNYRVGDGYAATIEQQYAFMCPRNLEVYKIKEFTEVYHQNIDRDFINIDEYIERYCHDLIEIYDE